MCVYVCVFVCERWRKRYPSKGGAGAESRLWKFTNVGWCTNLRTCVTEEEVMPFVIKLPLSTPALQGPASGQGEAALWGLLTPVSLRLDTNEAELYMLVVCLDNYFFPIDDAKVHLCSVLNIRFLLNSCLGQGMHAYIDLFLISLIIFHLFRCKRHVLLLFCHRHL